MVFWTICLWRNVVGLCHKQDPVMCGMAMHQWILFVA